MELKLYDTLTKEKRVFTPLDPNNVRMYVCGPTVYDFAHIGNARPVIVFDVLFRLLRHIYGEKHVTYVRNITDVDDKINDRAARDFPGMDLNEAIRKVTEKTEKQFHSDVDALGCWRPTVEPRATEHIDEMIDIIGMLLENGHAYIARGKEGREVLFEVARMKRYGELSNRKLDEQIEGARVAVEDHKKNPADFVLWKESSADQPGWSAEFPSTPVYPSNVGTVRIFGRPGWHIECSAMAWKYLGKEFDIHAGGIDLVFPHHENEIAQSCCAFHTSKMAETWMHNGFLQVEGEKMSKSLGNFYTINELLNTRKFGSNQWHGYVLRLAMLMTHYRQPIDWTVDRLVDARRLLKEWIDTAYGVIPESLSPPAELVSVLADDLNTSAVVALLHSYNKDARNPANISAAKKLSASLQFLGVWRGEKTDDIYGYGVEVGSGPSKYQVEPLLEARAAARARKDFAESDRIRDELAKMGVAIKDGKDADGKPITTWEIAR